MRSVKAALSVALKEFAPKEETLTSILAKVEFIINSRPLTHVSVDPKDRVCNSESFPNPGRSSSPELEL